MLQRLILQTYRIIIVPFHSEVFQSIVFVVLKIQDHILEPPKTPLEPTQTLTPNYFTLTLLSNKVKWRAPCHATLVLAATYFL